MSATDQTTQPAESGRPREVMIVSGEASGELYGSHLIQGLRALDPTLSFFGIGGGEMRRAGAELLFDADTLSVVGLVEVGAQARQLWRAYRGAKSELLRRRPQLLILIDFPDFNLRLAAAAHRAGIPVLYFVSPQVWAWRSRRIRQIARTVDLMLVILPFEVDLYASEDLDVRFVGHPLVDLVPVEHDREGVRRELGVGEGQRLVALLPGSRTKELERLLPTMLEAARRLSAERPELRYVLPLAGSLDRGTVLAQVAASGVDVEVVDNQLHRLVSAADLAIVASGTATLETALMLTPMIIVYRVHPLTYALALALTKIEHVGLANLVAGRRIVPELIQNQCTADNIVAEAGRLLDDPEAVAATRAALLDIRGKLGAGGTFRRAADAAYELIGSVPSSPGVEDVTCSTA